MDRCGWKNARCLFPSSPMIPEGLRVSACIAPPTFHGMPDTAWFKKIGFHMPQIHPNPTWKVMLGPLRHSHLSMYSMNLKQQKTTYILIIYISIMWVSNSQVFTSDFQKSYLEQVFFCSDAIDHLLWGVLRIAQASRVVELLTSLISRPFPPGCLRVHQGSRENGFHPIERLTI